MFIIPHSVLPPELGQLDLQSHRSVVRMEGNAWVPPIADQLLLGVTHVIEYIRSDTYKLWVIDKLIERKAVWGSNLSLITQFVWPPCISDDSRCNTCQEWWTKIEENLKAWSNQVNVNWTCQSAFKLMKLSHEKCIWSCLIKLNEKDFIIVQIHLLSVFTCT